MSLSVQVHWWSALETEQYHRQTIGVTICLLYCPVHKTVHPCTRDPSEKAFCQLNSFYLDLSESVRFPMASWHMYPFPILLFKGLSRDAGVYLP